MWIGVSIFALTYLVISARRLGWMPIGRPGGALLGAVLCVAAGVLGPEAALRAVDGHTLLLLFGMMGMGAFLAKEGFFDRAGEKLAAWARTPARLLGALIWSSGALAALITNDAVCVLGAPLVVGLIRRHSLPPLPFLLGLATAANTGSVATLVGNPQNMLCAILGGLSYRSHLVLMLPVAIAGLAINHGLIWWMFRRELSATSMTFGEEAACLASDCPPGPSMCAAMGSNAGRLFTARIIVALGGILISALLYLLGADLAWTAAGGCAFLLLALRPDPEEIWSRVDWSVLLFFAGLFVVVEGLVQSGAPAWFFERFPLWAGDGSESWWRLSGLFLLGSNVVSNVPFILVVREPVTALADPRLGWELLAMASTFAGNLTLIGSVANIIVAEKAREVGGLGFWEYLRVGAPLTLLTTALGTAWVLLVW
ncbi:MAG: SLC13 family permease [Polyangia bacterium]|jgi:Na+/H+ antiporter NhaD/arsenite permease-like protein|nr:SLC13 family permease [Polyangia bacterium]